MEDHISIYCYYQKMNLSHVTTPTTDRFNITCENSLSVREIISLLIQLFIKAEIMMLDRNITIYHIY